MLEIYLVVELKDGEDENGHLRATRHIKLDALPAVGHKIRVDERVLCVDSVLHDADVTDREGVTTEIVCKATAQTVGYFVDKCGWDMG